jgi:acyl-CoA hydrolase/RimJ/RimL family protein N-acetyltransferase
MTTAAEAIGKIASGRRILIGSGAAEPSGLVEALVADGGHLTGCEIVHLLTLGPAPYVAPEMQGRFRHAAFFIGPNVRDAVREGRADFMPVFLSEIPELIYSGRMRIDVALIQVSPPDAHGFVSLGVSVDVVRAAVDTADLVIAEVNPRMPRTLGDAFVPLGQLHHRVQVDRPLPELGTEALDPVSQAIGEHVAALIPDGATLQMGIGKIPNAVCRALGGHAELGVHTEMFSDGVMALVKAGVITGRRKTLLPGKIVTSFAMGSQALYAWLDDNPAVEMRSSRFTNDPVIIARNEAMIAINSALAVDLTGQVAADTVSGQFYSGIGGQVDFIRGAARSRGGKPIIALPSTARGGQVSRIQATFEPGTGVVTSRGDVRYVVTEYGVASLWGKTVRQRALALIEVAHPDFRSELMDAAKARRFVLLDQPVPRGPAGALPQAVRVPLPDGASLLLRPIQQSDEDSLRELLYGLSSESAYRRFMGPKVEHSHEELQRLANVDCEESVGWIAIHHDGKRPQAVAVARYDLQRATRMGELAIAVADAWQGQGIGTRLLTLLAASARALGHAGLTAQALASNAPMLRAFQKSGLKHTVQLKDGTYLIELPVESAAPPEGSV